MTLRFSKDGPELPGELVDSLLDGEVVFLCGTGVSARHMPDFRLLVDRTYESLAMQMTESERRAYEQERYEEVLGSLSRRLSDPDAVTDVVSGLLAVPNDPDLGPQRTILRLSRALDNRITVVTTNFDTLLERASVEIDLDVPPAKMSFAGQALPAPGSSTFYGIVHMHGRLEDQKIEIEKTPLVLTSANYGDAYMRSGWASRFLFDLARCKTIVLVGYSASDAPVRYFLNVLEADRARFPDLKPVFALDGYENDPNEATELWGTLAVEPLPYCKVNADTGKDDHSPLWRDLEALADFVEQPDLSRQERVRAILENPVRQSDTHARQELAWLLGRHRNLRSVVLNTVTDPEWFDFFLDEELWPPDESAGVIAAWVARDFIDRDRLRCACTWQRRLGRPFTEKIKQHLLHEEGLTEDWTRIWRIFCLAEPILGHNLDYYRIRRRIKSGVILDSDLRAAVNLLKPVLDLDARVLSGHLEEKDGEEPEKLRNIVRVRMSISDQHGATKLVELLHTLPDRALRILELATQELQSALELEVELEMITDEHDINDFTVPSIEKHAQNRHREDVNYLVRVIVETLSKAAESNREHVRRVVAGWQRLPGRIGLRLRLHAMRNSDIFDADEAMEALLSVSERDFWMIRREVPLLMQDRAAAASAGLVSQVESRILETADSHYDGL